jgi:hypothetical protein
MKKRLSHFAYNERSRSGWTLSIPPFTSLSPVRSTIKLLPMSPARLLPLSPVRTLPRHGGEKRGGLAFIFRVLCG